MKKLFFILLLAAASVCSAQNDILKVGMKYQGGIIAYILEKKDPGYDPAVQHGLIVALSDIPDDTHWWNGSYVTTTGTDKTGLPSVLGSGNSNTEAIVAKQGEANIADYNANYAAMVCYNYSVEGYSDWYLPSKEELNKIYLNRNLLGGLKGVYWSSTDLDMTHAWMQNFDTEKKSSLSNSKNTYCRIRPVRSF